MTSRVVQLLNETQSTNFDVEDVEMTGPDISVQHKVNHLSDILQIYSILSEFAPFFEHTSNPCRTASPTWFSPKLSVLIDILQHQPPTFQGLVFVEQRQTASCLARILACTSRLEGLVRCAELVGQSTDTDKISHMGFKRQQETVKAFRQGTINLCKLSPLYHTYESPSLDSQ
jgi:ERCC4-related helicase